MNVSSSTLHMLVMGSILLRGPERGGGIMLSSFRVIGSICAVALAWPGLARGAPARFDCDTATGAFSEVDIPQAGPQYHVEGTLTAVRNRTDGHWAPIAEIGLLSADGQAYAGVRAVSPDAGEKIELSIETKYHKKNNIIPVGNTMEKNPNRFSIDLLNGRLTIQVNGKTFDGPDLSEGASLRMSCSSGEFVFQDLDWQEPPQGNAKSAP